MPYPFEFFNWLSQASVADVKKMIANKDLEVLASETLLDGNRVRFELAFSKGNDWYMIHPDFCRWEHFKGLPLNAKPTFLPFEFLSDQAQKWCLAE